MQTKNETNNSRKGVSAAALLGCAAFLITGCVNSKLGSGKVSSSAETAATTIATGDSYFISSVTITAGTSTSAGVATLRFDAVKSTGQVSNSCSLGTGSNNAKPCMCQFAWKEINQTTGTSITVPRAVKTKVDTIQPMAVSCKAPDPSIYNNEIANGTTIKISLVPGTGNSSSFTSSVYDFLKSGTTQAGTFQDAQGHYFDNVLHYSCYEQFKRGMSIISKIYTLTSTASGSSGTTSQMPLASQFCVRKASGTGGSSDGCISLPPSDNSAQAYYYNLFIRDSERGGINRENDRYICPMVQEGLPGTSQNGLAWPLDSTFALSLGPTPNFNVGVEAFTKLSNGASDPNSKSTGCYAGTDGEQGTTPDSGSLLKSCLGFAAKPNKDGTCPTFKDSIGKTQNTYRLRRFVALYPPVFDTNGDTINQAQGIDTIYVIDRPVLGSPDPDKPYTMRGPKPCPFSFFDNKGVLETQDIDYTGFLPRYGATNDSKWEGKNIDGIQLPNTDSPNSCSALIPVINDTRTVMSLATVNAANPKYPKVYIRPIHPWAPHYEEDLDFQACAPLAQPMRDAPLHFSKDATTGNVSWCSESYPSQNDNIASLDTRPDLKSPFSGKVIPYTSHVVKNSGSGQCTATVPSSVYPPAPATDDGKYYPYDNGGTCNAAVEGAAKALARHPKDKIIDYKIDGTKICADQTCDRTVVRSSLAWPRFPLLAPAADVEKAIASDSTFGCTVTYDAGAGKEGKSTPTKGCCGDNVHVWTGFDSSNIYKDIRNAHLEPDVKCVAPTY